MTSEINIEKIKKAVSANIGKSFDIVTKRGRKKVIFENCTLSNVYPSIFIATFTDKKSGKETGISFSYTDILTKNTCLFPAFSIKSKKGA